MTQKKLTKEEIKNGIIGLVILFFISWYFVNSFFSESPEVNTNNEQTIEAPTEQEKQIYERLLFLEESKNPNFNEKITSQLINQISQEFGVPVEDISPITTKVIRFELTQ